MKRIFYLLLGVLMFWSCAETYEYRDVLNEAKHAPKEIKFDNLFAVATKAVYEDSTDLQADTIGVYAKIVGASNITSSKKGFFIYNDSLAYDNVKNVWKLKQLYFWPKMATNANRYQKVNFFGYEPIDKKATLSDSVIVVNVDATGINENAKDVVYGANLLETYDKIYEGNADSTVKGRPGYVDFKFKHKMAWISFEAKTTTPFDTIIIDSIVVKVKQSKGKLYINTKSTENGTISDTAIAAYDAAVIGTPSAYTYKFVPDTSVVKIDTLVYHRVADFIAIPQLLDNEFTATIHYTAKIDGVTYVDSNTPISLHGGPLTETHKDGDGTNDNCHPANWEIQSWNAGLKYTYHINFDWQEIKFSASVTGWDIVNNGGYYRIY